MSNLDILYQCIHKFSGLIVNDDTFIKKENVVNKLDKKITEAIRTISEHINVNVGTTKRWIELKNVPGYYSIDLRNLLGIEIDYSELSAKDKDQFFTNVETAKLCYEIFNNKLAELGIDTNEYTYIEPSAGNGSFYNLFPEDRRIGIDIESKIENVIKQDYLTWKPEVDGKYLVVGNPPFGLRSNLALRFLNNSNYAEFVGFILPQIFESDGKGSTKSRVEGLNLIHSEKIKPNFEFPDGKSVVVNVIFQIWAKNHSVEVTKDTCKSYIRIYSLSDGGTIATTRNKKMIGNCDIYLPQTCFGEDKMKLYDDFELVPKRTGYGIVYLKDKEDIVKILNETDWSKVAFKSTNGAYNLRTDLIEKVLTDKNYKD
jgi:hypothetical protein